MNPLPITSDTDENLELDHPYPLVYKAFLPVFEQEKSVYISRAQFTGMAANISGAFWSVAPSNRNRRKRAVDAFNEDKLNLLNF